MLAQGIGLGIFRGQLLVPLGGFPVGVGLAGGGEGVGRLGQGGPVRGHAFVGGHRGLGGLFVGVEEGADLLGLGGQIGHACPGSVWSERVWRTGGASAFGVPGCAIRVRRTVSGNGAGSVFAE